MVPVSRIKFFSATRYYVSMSVNRYLEANGDMHR